MNKTRDLADLRPVVAWAVLALVLAAPGLAFGDGHRQGGARHVRHGGDHAYHSGPSHGRHHAYHGGPSHGKDSVRVVGGGSRHHGGRTYPRHWDRPHRTYHPHRYWHRPPAASFYFGLPFGCYPFTVGTSVYYQLEREYYTPAPSGYVVTTRPSATLPSEAEELSSIQVSGRVFVSAPALNVRSGPSLGHQVVAVVHQGEWLDLREASGGWYYVATPGGEMGWVMSQYTRRDGDGGSG